MGSDALVLVRVVEVMSQMYHNLEKQFHQLYLVGHSCCAVDQKSGYQEMQFVWYSGSTQQETWRTSQASKETGYSLRCLKHP